MKTTGFILLLPLILISACMSSNYDFPNPDVQVIGHRGHASHYPQNTIEGFLSGLSLGVDAFELDLVVSKDHKVVVSHEPYMKSRYMLTPEGKRIQRSKEKDYNLYQMTYDSIKKFDSGSLGNKKFRNQRSLATYKPLLEEVFDTVEAYRSKKSLGPVKYFLEIKSDPDQYDVFQPKPETFVDLVMQVVKDRNLQESVIIMSFDATILNVLKEVYPEIEVSLLWYKKGIEESLNQLSFTPENVSPHYKQLKNAETVADLQKQGIKVYPWTVNSTRDIRKMLKLGTDGIISDYPERVLQVKKNTMAIN